MKNSKDDLQGEPDGFREDHAPYALDLPVAPEWWSRPPQGSWEDGYRLGVLALEQVKDRPEIFEERNRRMCSVEFQL